MKIKNHKIIEATEDELYVHWLKSELDEIISFPDYMEQCKAGGTKIVEETIWAEE